MAPTGHWYGILWYCKKARRGLGRRRLRGADADPCGSPQIAGRAPLLPVITAPKFVTLQHLSIWADNKSAIVLHGLPWRSQPWRFQPLGHVWAGFGLPSLPEHGVSHRAGGSSFASSRNRFASSA